MEHVSPVKNKTHNHLEKGVDLVKFSFAYFSYLYLHACLIRRLCLTLCNPLNGNLPSSPVHGLFQVRILRGGCHFLLQRIFLTQGLNPSLMCLLHCRRILYPQPSGKPWSSVSSRISHPGRSSDGGPRPSSEPPLWPCLCSHADTLAQLIDLQSPRNEAHVSCNFQGF